MPLHMDVHRNVDATVEAVAEARERDVETREEHAGICRNHRVEEDSGAVSRLLEGPSRGAGEQVHREANGPSTDEIHEVREG